MNMEELYELMKKALKYFELSFHSMNIVDVKLVNGTHIRFQYGDEAIEFRIPSKE